MTQHEVITQIRDAITTGDYGLAVRALNEYRDFEIEKFTNEEPAAIKSYIPKDFTIEERKLNYPTKNH